MNAFIFKFPKAIAAMLKGYIPIKLGGYLDIATADFFLDKNGVVLEAKYSLKDAAQAHKDLEARLLTGPAVIIP